MQRVIPDGLKFRPDITSMRLPHSFWMLLVVGLVMRCVALNQPLLDAHLLRQCQTAAATQSLIEQPTFPLTSQIPWLGDFDARYVQELPIYNHLVACLYRLVGNLDISGKMISILLWIVSFFLFQPILRRMITPEQTVWANTMFVVAPLSVFYAQAFMPEMLVQALAFGFLLGTIRYAENPTLPRWLLVTAVGLVAVLVKLPEVSHLYLILAVGIVRQQGWPGIFRMRHLLAGLVTVVLLKMWGNFADSVNAPFLPEWSPTKALPEFIGTFASRFTIKPWVMIFLYIGAYIVTGPAALAAIWGLWIRLRERRCGFLGLWLFSIALFYVVWFGNAGSAQSYYNLPALGPICALFGIGTSALLSCSKLACWPRTAAFAVCAILILCVTPVLSYLFKQDRQILAAADWTRQHTQSDDLILFRANHRWDMVEYYYNPVFAYYAGRRAFVRTPRTPERYIHAGLDRARYAVATLPPPPVEGLLGRLNDFRGVRGLQEEKADWLETAGFEPFLQAKGFIVHKKQ